MDGRTDRYTETTEGKMMKIKDKIILALALSLVGLLLGIGVGMLFIPPGHDVYVKVEDVVNKDGRLYAKGFLYVQDSLNNGYVHKDNNRYELVRISDFVYKDLSVGDYIRVNEPSSAVNYDGIIYKEWVLQLYWIFYLVVSMISVCSGSWFWSKYYDLLKEDRKDEAG